MAFRSRLLASSIGAVVFVTAANSGARAQVFVVGEKSAMADVSTDFHPTRVELPTTPLTERGRRELIRNLEAEQGFAHRALPLGQDLVLMANGNLKPGGEAYKQMLYKKGQAAGPGDRVAITTVSFKGDRIIFDINGGPYLKHRFLRHIDLNDSPLVADNGEQVTGFRVTLMFEGGIPEISAPEVKALLDPIIDFGVKTSAEAFADSLPPFLKDAISQHDVLVGMDHKMVLAAMGPPESKVRELVPGSADRHYEEWIFGHVPQTVRFVRFEGDRVTQVRVAALGQAIAVHTENEMRGYLDPQNIHEVAMGDANPGNGEESSGRAAPTILKQGEISPGSSVDRVKLPVPAPDPGSQNGQDKNSPATATSPGTGGPDKPANQPTAPADKSATQLVALTY
ncbi:MAG TPA: hypothetical protein VGN01_09535 [Acidobacteriaceae bacterium]|jgi:hypothetical protein